MAVSLLILIVAGLGAAAILFWIFKKNMGQKRPLCNSCQANSPRYCHKPERPHVYDCTEYLPRGRR